MAEDIFDPDAFISSLKASEDHPYKQALIQKIQSGVTDYTYGPGSPNATPADMRQKTGAHDNPLRTGDVALPQADYNLFSPEERAKLGIADTSWIKEGKPTPRGSVERYFGPEIHIPENAVYHGPYALPSPSPGETPRQKIPPATEAEIDAILGKSQPEATPKRTTKVPVVPLSDGRTPIPQFQTPQLPTEQQIPTGPPPQLSQAIGVGQPIPTAGPTPDLFAGAVQSAIEQQTPQTLLAGPPTAAAVHGFDPDAFIRANQLGKPSPTPTPITTPMPSHGFDPDAFISQLSSKEIPQPQEKGFIRGTAEGLLATAKGMVPTSLEGAKDLAVMMAAPVYKEKFLEQAMRTGLLDYETAKAAIHGGAYEKGKAVGIIGPQVASLVGGLRAGAAPVARSGEAPAMEIPPVQQMPSSAATVAQERPSVPGRGAGTSNRVLQDAYGEGAPVGRGANVEQIAIDAQNLIDSGQLDPYAVLSQRPPGMTSDVEYAGLALEHERLVNRAVRLDKQGDPLAGEAAREANDFANAIQPHKTAASNRMRQMQGELNYDLSSTFGMEQYMKAELDRAPTAKERGQMKERAQGINRAQKDAIDSLMQADRKVQRRYAKVPDISMDEASSIVRDWFKDCV